VSGPLSSDGQRFDRKRFDGQVAFITGAARGFGAAFAAAFAREGAAVAVADVDDATARDVSAEIEAAGGRAVAVRCDVADEADVDQAVATVVASLGDISIVVNNAGRHLMKYNQPFGTLTRAEIRGLFEVNIMGIVNVTQACQESMRRRGGGAVVNISSMAGYQVSSPYGVSKLAVRGLTTAFAGELAADGVRVNAIAPGLMATESAMADLPPALIEEFVERRQLIHRLGTVDDIVKTALFLCSDAASFITGETVRVTGGVPLGV
jgi:3-oxoacyl-[acyl-carrier protein] reductase